MKVCGDAVAQYLGVEDPTSASSDASAPSTRRRGRLLNNKPAKHLKSTRHDSFANVGLTLAHGRLNFPPPASMRKQGFSVPDNFFSAVAACARARSADREHTGRVTTDGTAVCDFKGRFTAAKGGGATSLIAFRHPVSGYVHEEYLTDQTVPTAVTAFVLFRDLMRVKFRVRINYMIFDRDASFNRDFRAQLRKLDVDSNMSGANDHWELGAIETYWDTWTSMVAASSMHAGVDTTYWRFASGMANHILNRTPTSSKVGFVSPIEFLTNETPDLSNLRVPFSPSYVAQEKKKGALACRALEGMFVGYPEDTRDGVWVYYMPSTKSTQVRAATLYSTSGPTSPV
jgi:hypothetical protein